MRYSPQVWAQLKNITSDELIRAIHYHPRKTYGPKLLKNLLIDIGWNEDDLRRLKLIK